MISSFWGGIDNSLFTELLVAEQQIGIAPTGRMNDTVLNELIESGRTQFAPVRDGDPIGILVTLVGEGQVGPLHQQLIAGVGIVPSGRVHQSRVADLQPNKQPDKMLTTGKIK